MTPAEYPEWERINSGCPTGSDYNYRIGEYYIMKDEDGDTFLEKTSPDYPERITYGSKKTYKLHIP